MYQKIVIAQNVRELIYIIRKVKSKAFNCLPLNLKTQLYCENNNIPYIRLVEIVDSTMQKKIQNDSKKILNKIDDKFINSESLKKEFNAFIRHRIYSVIFLHYVIKNLNKKKKISNIYISGWDIFDKLASEKNYFVSNIINSICKNYKVTIIDKFTKKNLQGIKIKNYKLITAVPSSKKSIVLNNLSYNFKRILIWSLLNRYKLLIPVFKKINFFKKIIARILNIYFIEIININHTKIKNKNNFSKIYFNKINLTNCIFSSTEKINSYFLSQEKKSEILKKIFEKKNIKLAITNIARGIDGCIIENAKKFKVNTICIPHGTLSGYFNNYDKLYKKNISEAIYSKSSKFNAAQSKIAKLFFKKYAKKNYIETGNLIFNEMRRNTGDSILYAVTIKDFDNFHPIGVESFFEYINNLENLDHLAKKNNLKIIVKPHPSEFDAIPYLDKKFSNLNFTKIKNKILFKKIKILISFSSTMIEDSLYSNVPVILFDKWRRYQHCVAEKNILQKNSAVYYVNNINDLEINLKTINESKNINFNKYIFKGKAIKNFDNLLTRLTK